MDLGRKGFIAAGLLGLAVSAGCSNDRPHEYSNQRPPADQLSPYDTGLQSKDVLAAASQMEMDILASPRLTSSPVQWTVVIGTMEDQTTERIANYNIFLEHLRANLSMHGQGRVSLIENKGRYHGMQSQELEGAGAPNDPFGQGAGGIAAAGPAGIQPNFELKGLAMDMPNRSTNYYQLQFSIVNLQTREEVWVGEYAVKIAR